MKKCILVFPLAVLLLAGFSQNKMKQNHVRETSAIAEANVTGPLTYTENKTTMYDELAKYIKSIEAEMDAIPQERKDLLTKVAFWMKDKKQANENFKVALQEKWNIKQTTFGSTIVPIPRYKLNAKEMTAKQGAKEFVQILDDSLKANDLKRCNIKP